MAAFTSCMMDSEHIALFENKVIDDSDSDVDQNFNFLENERTKNGDETVRLNICGKIYETHLSVLNKYPKSLLGNAAKRATLWDEQRNEYYVDTSQSSFEAIFQFYQTGRLRKPFEVPLETFFEQLEHFEINADIVRRYKESEGVIFEAENVQPTSEPKRTIWETLETPSASRAARICAYVSVTLVVISLVVFCVETLPQYQDSNCKKVLRYINSTVTEVELPNFHNGFFVLEATCVLFFTFEYFGRLYSCPAKPVFLRGLLNWVDLATVIPFYVTLTMTVLTENCRVDEGSGVIMVLRVLRVFRVFKLSKHSAKLQMWSYAIRASMREFFTFFFFLMVSALFFASIIYFAELGDPRSQISNIPDGIWWGLATMTTVGYGDVVPVTVWGKGCAAACVIFGVLAIALPTPIIVANFNKYYKTAGRNV